MTPRLLVLPAWWYSPAVEAAVPAFKAGVADLRRECEVETFYWPSVRGVSDVEPTWQATLEAILERLTPEHHFLSVGAPAMAIMAASRGRPRSLISTGIQMPAATYRSLGFLHIASAATRFIGSSYPFVRRILVGADEDTVRAMTALVDSGLDIRRTERLLDSYHTLDLVEENPLVAVPTLYLWAAAGSELLEHVQFIRRFATNYREAELRLFGEHMEEEEAGRELARHVLDFIASLDHPRLDHDGHQVTIAGQPIQLTTLEFGVFRELHQADGAVLSREALLERVWGYDYGGGSNVVDAVVLSLRKKLGDHAGLIETIRGAGYSYNES